MELLKEKSNDSFGSKGKVARVGRRSSNITYNLFSSKATRKYAKELKAKLILNNLDRFEQYMATKKMEKFLINNDDALRPKSLPKKGHNPLNTNNHKLKAQKANQFISLLKSKVFREFSYALEPNSNSRPYMEDFINIQDVLNQDPSKALFLLCDGHGKPGYEIANIVKDRLPELFVKMLKDCSKVEDCFNESFSHMDCELVEDTPEAGTTANLVYITIEENKRVAYCGNVGDSRTIIVRNNSVERLSYDHKAKDKNELRRVKKEGGLIYGGRYYGQLAITRTLGDHIYKNSLKGLSSVPFLTKVEIENSDRFIIIASDGIWDVISDERVAEIVFENNIESAEVLANILVKYALDNFSKDNISVIAIKLN